MISRLAGDSTWSRYSLAWSGIQAVVMMALESVILYIHILESNSIDDVIPSAKYLLSQRTTNITSTEVDAEATTLLQSTRVLSVYHVLFIVAQLFQLILLCDAMLNKNTIQIIAIVIFNCSMVAYTGVQVKQASDILAKTPTDSLVNMILIRFENAAAPTPVHASLPYEIAVVCLMVIFASGFAYIAYKLYKEFGWSIYKKIGADLSMRDMYKVYQIFIMILKFDVFFQLGFSAQFLSVVVLEASPDMWSVLTIHLILSTGASIILPLIAWWGLKRESKISMWCFIVCALGTLIYNIYKLCQVSFLESDRFAGAQKFLKLFSWTCMRNFNNGLNAHIGKVSGSNIYPMESVGGSSKRWSIE
ncbi:hypothetical protein BGZ79_009801 [Entomortierella chlamydospora]|nr:hypothetical protein BGZ79_009801 [Entomortierella chlamydospora]